MECSAGDPIAANNRLEILKNIPLLIINEDILEIARELIAKNIIPEKAAEDGLHIATSIVHNVDYLLTWNCKHIANPEIQRNIAQYLSEVGLYLPFICTPEQLLGEDDVN